MPRIFVIGDIHGCSKTFQFLLHDILNITKNDRIYCLGDYIDRGQDSKGVIDIILELRNKGYRIHTLRGNHEEMMMDSVKNSNEFKKWMINGGDCTLNSFKIKTYDELPLEYKQFLKRTKYYIKKGKFLFVHAGFNFDNDNIFDDKTSMLWKRYFSVDKKKLVEKRIIHGHTPKSLYSILKSSNSSIINIDSGCVFKNHDNLGYLVAFEIGSNSFFYTENID